MRVLITGCAGFVGAYLCRAIQQAGGIWEQAEIFAGVYNEEEKKRVSLDPAHILLADITNRRQTLEMVQRARPDCIIHLAAQSSVALSFQKPELTMAVNVTGTQNLLDAVEQVCKEARILLIGSIDQYGSVEQEKQPVKETQPLTGRSPYGQSKIQQEAMALAYGTKRGLDIVLARSATHIGPGQATTFAIADWVEQVKEMKQGKRPHELTVGNLDVIRDIADVRDVVRAYLCLIEKGASGEIYNVSTAKGRCLKEIPPLLGRLAGIMDLQVKIDPARFRPADIPMLVADNTKICQETGWRVQYQLEETLIQWLERTDTE